MAPGLSLHSPRWQPAWLSADVPQPHGDHASWWPLARRWLELRPLGGLHGIALSVYHRFRGYWDSLPDTVRRAGMFLFVVLSWVPFRLHNLRDILACYR